MLRGLYHLAFNPRARAEWRWILLRKAADKLMPGYRLVWPQMRWWQDEDFNAFLRKFHELPGYNSERRWTIQQLCKLAKTAPGDTAECGVLEGSSSYLIARSFPDRQHFMFDSFEGCSAPTDLDNGYFDQNSLACVEQVVKENLKEFPNAHCMKGWIPDRFAEVSDRRFAFVHIDVQQEKPTVDSLEFFYPRVSPGGIIVFDDYGFTTCPGARQGIDKFMNGKTEQVVDLPIGSAFILKR